MPVTQEFVDLEQYLLNYLGSEIGKIIDAMKNENFLVRIPEEDDIDKHPEEINILIAKTANSYAAAARLAGMARAHQKLCKARYDRKFKASKVGKSEAERDRVAMIAAEDEHLKLANSEAIAELADSLESAARVSSESIRRIALSNKAYYNASNIAEGGF